MAVRATDEFSKKYEEEIENMPLLSSEGKVRRRRAASMSDSEIMTIFIMFHFGTFDNFKHYYLHYITSLSDKYNKKPLCIARQSGFKTDKI